MLWSVSAVVCGRSRQHHGGLVIGTGAPVFFDAVSYLIRDGSGTSPVTVTLNHADDNSWSFGNGAVTITAAETQGFVNCVHQLDLDHEDTTDLDLSKSFNPGVNGRVITYNPTTDTCTVGAFGSPREIYRSIAACIAAVLGLTPEG